MSREMFGDETTVYRAAITRSLTSLDGTVKLNSWHAGPYASKPQASAAITRAKKWDGSQGYGEWRYEVKTTGYVEFANTWERVV